MPEVAGYYYANGIIPRWNVERLREDFPDLFPEGNMPADVRGETEGKDINSREEQQPF